MLAGHLGCALEQFVFIYDIYHFNMRLLNSLKKDLSNFQSLKEIEVSYQSYSEDSSIVSKSLIDCDSMS